MSYQTDIQYRDLEIRIMAQQAKGYPVVLTFQGQTAEGYLPADVLDWWQTSGPLADGQALADHLFADPTLGEAWANFRGQSRYLRIRLRIDPTVPKLHVIPWELLQHRGQTLAADSDTPFSRYLAHEQESDGLITERPLKLLVAVANPDNLAEQDLTPIPFKERNVVKQALAEVDETQLIIDHLPEPVTMKALEAKLSEGYHLLHLIAHGQFKNEQTVLFLADEDNQVQEVAEDEFVPVIARHRPQLIFLSSCDTGRRSPADAWRGLAPQLIKAGLPAVLAMQDKVPVDTAREFSRIFYQQLLADGRLDVAANRARATVLTEKLTGASIPVLFSRLPHNRLLAEPKQAKPRPATPEQRHRLWLLEKVRERWIARVLEPSLEATTRLAQNRQEQREAVAGAFEELGMPDRPNRSLSLEQPMLELFEEVGQGALLILGPPGSEKTASLLELARDAISRAEQDASQPIPVIFELATWYNAKQSLADWLVAELEQQYEVDPAVARSWIERDRLLLLLDGLDSVEPNRQAACVQAVNDFHQTNGLTPLVVCSEARAYEALEVKLRLANAIRLSPLEPLDTEADAIDLGPKVDTMDVEIRLLAEQPEGYPLELTVTQADGQRQEFSGDHLQLDTRPTLSNPPTAADGEQLFNWLFTDPTLRDKWQQIRQQSRRRRIQLRLDPDEQATPDLHALPWELLRDATPGLPPQALATDGATPFCRYWPGSGLPPEPVTERPLKLLVALANPPGLAENFRRPGLQPDLERQLITEALFGLDEKTQLQVTYVGLDEPLSLAALETALRQDHHILHLIGAGAFNARKQQGTLFLAGSDQQARPVPAAELVEMLKNLGQLPRLAILSDGLAAEDETSWSNSAEAWRALGSALLDAGIPAVLALQSRLPEAVAYQFFRSFYRQIVQSGRLDRISNLARATLLSANPATSLNLPTESIEETSPATIQSPNLQSPPPILFSRVVDLQLFAPPQRALSKAEGEERRNQLILLEKVRSAWVEGVLEQSLHDVAMLELGKTAETEAVERPLGLTLAPGQEMIDIFDQIGTLLILGAPGAGKTFALLELARDLLNRAEPHPDHPIPVIFNLSSWQDPKQSIAEWMADELSLKYQIPRKIGRRWISEDKILPLLDGLDEVKAELRADCVRAINAFRDEHRLAGLVVCSRTEEYERLTQEDNVRLKLEGAIQLQPLSQEQIDDYLHDAGPQLAAVRKTLHHDAVLQEMAQTPLMLNVMTLAYQGKSVEELQGFDTVEARRENLFAEYINQMFSRIVRTEYRPFSDEQTVGWLKWLAQKLGKESQSVFLIERLQPSWLNNRGWQWGYLFSSRLISGLLIGFLFAMVMPGLPNGGFFGFLGGLIVSGIDGLRFELNDRLHFLSRLPTWSVATLNVVAISLITNLIFSYELLFTWTVPVQPVSIEEFLDQPALLSNQLYLGFVFGLLFGIRGARQNLADDIQPVEKLNWSLKRALRGVIIGALVGISILGLSRIIILLLGLGNPIRFSAGGILIEPYLILALQDDLFIGAVFGGVLGALFGGLGFGMSAKTTVPNQGIKLSLRNAGLAALISGLSLGSISLWSFGAFTAMTLGGAVLLIGTPVLLWYGGLDVIQHYTLRFVLWFKGHTPRNYAHFLDYAAERIFLRKVGGGYIFVHRLLQGYFAGLGSEALMIGQEQTPRDFSRENIYAHD